VNTEAELPTEEPTEAPDAKPRRGRLRSFAPVIAAALCIPCAVLLVVFLLRLHSKDATDTSRSDAARSARTAAAELLSYDYRHINDDVTQAKGLITKPFDAEYAETAKTLQTEAVKLKAIVQANVRTVSVEDATRNRVVVLLFVDQSSVKQLPGGTQPVTRVDEQRVRFTMVKTHGRWLVSEVAALI
jgi:Mce-associated membrane protein